MRFMEELLDYFQSRDNQANFPSIVSARKADDDTTFAVCFAKNDEGMQTLREKILEDMEKKIASKYAEVDEVRERCKTLQDEIAAEESCKCEWKTDSNGHRRRKITKCQRCKLESTLASTRHSVPVYERPLPPTEVIQHAVMFELKLPSQLAELRDALAFLNFEILTLSPFDGHFHCVQKWLEYSSVTTYHPTCKQGKVLNLSSSYFPASKTHHTQKNPDVLTNSNKNFIVNNGMNCIYNDQKVICGTGNVEQSCTFQISNTCSPAREMYQRLQYTVAGTSHSQNQVIAESYNCHRDMTIAEFISFGSIRAGHRIQLRNLRRSISNRNIALERESVVCLIFQTLWQLGPKDQDGNRESHLDFTSNDPFAQEFLECLEQVVDLNETNYSHPLILLNVVAITMRIMELNQSSRELAVKLLRKCRNVVDGWVQRIEESIMKQTDCSSAGVQSLKKFQLEAALCSAFSFNTPSTALLNSLFQTNEDLFQWVSSMSRLHDFTELEALPISNFSRTLVQYAFDVALKVQEQIRLNFSNSLILHSFTVRQWNKANELNLVGENWRCVAHHSNLFYGEYIEAQSTIQHFVTFDILLGIFLVDGQPQGVLPATIEGHALYKRFFNNSRLRIQKDNQSYRTVLTFHGKHYEFVPKPGALHHHRIMEINEDCTLELLDPSLFQGYVASSFIHNYTHWLNIKDNIIYFRPLPFKNLEYNLPSDFSLTRNVSEGFWKLQDSKSGSHFLSIRSQEYATICEVMKKIEMREHINIVVDSKSGIVTAKLPRYNLKFHLIGEKLQSVEYPDFKISRDQRMGTLVGLRQGILLDNIASSDGTDIFQVQRRMLIVPHGALHVREAQTTHHHGVEVSLDSLRQPPFFSYEFDEELKRLKADKSKTAWLYLAALHAATSSGLPDIFSGITGTEMAVWILQSALVWSNSPYDSESLAILKTISDFSPVRTFYGAGCGRNSTQKREMEITTWPKGLPSLAAFDGFTFIVDRLIADSQRIAELFPGSTSLHSSRNSQTILQIRAYRRSLSFYNQDVAVKPDYLPKSLLSYVGTGNVETPQLRAQLHCDQLLAVSQAIYCFDTMKYPLSDKKYDLISYLCTSQPLSASNPFENLQNMSLSQLLGFEFRVNWLKLYSHCLIRGKKNGPDNQVKLNEEIQAWKILLANVGYRDPSFVTLQQILNIHFIASHALYFPEPPAPDYSYTNPAANTFVASEIVRLLMNNSYSFMCWEDYRKTKCYLVHSDTLFWKLEPAPRWCFSDHEEELKLYNEEKSQFELELKNDVNSILQAVTDDWPCHSVQTDKKRLFQSHKLMSEAALAKVNTQLNVWFKNHELKLFVQDVERILNIILSLSRSFGADERLQPSEEFLNQFGHMKIIKIPINIKTYDPPMIDLEAYLGSFVNADNLVLAKEIFSRGWRWRSDDSQNSIWKSMERRGLLIDRFVYSISTNLQSTISKQVILRTGICPRTTPLALLSYLMNHQQHQGQGLMKQSNLNCVVGAMAVLWSHMKRHNRIITLKSKGDAMSVELKREWENSGHENWSPAEHPEWLLLELDLDMMIRPIQVDVAKQMMNMPDGKNGVMQLNMGEGKTSVIVPMLCATLANESTLCRVTVLNSIFKTNLKILSFAIGGLLNRRVYTVPCRRDMDIGSACLQRINDAYSECLRMNGVVLTRPEHRLSFRLKIYDQIVKGNVAHGLKFLDTENWLRKHARDILDESDELLSVKYQLVYTIGTQVPIDGGDFRWKTCQKILKMVAEIADELYETFGSSVLEYNPTEQEESPEQFNHFRLLNDACRKEFYDRIANGFLQEIKLTSAQKTSVKSFLTEDNLDQETHSSALGIFQENPDLLCKVLLVSGYIRRGILELALSKRWRVEYGVDPKGLRRMAVPFRAKDVAAERTEFGHPDLAIVLTHLSYYYSGLSDRELQECFDCLKTKLGPDMIYSSWIQTIPKEKVPKFLQTYQGVNSQDPFHRDHLYNMFRKHKLIIDFWLSEKVFPKESKQFPGKIVMTAWDLCYERNQHPVCGFSGTNDSSILLPLQISQQDLLVLLDTNRKLEQTLLQPENNNHRGFHMGVTCKEILEAMKKDGLQVLIDSGAMMLQCDNEQVAKLWLEIDADIDAVVYFSRDNDMLVKCRGDSVRNVQDLPLELSPFRSRLGRCGVFLDDQHSRGTDLKFPSGLKACVTVGTRMRRDKLMQACMRMRKLGKGHSVTFYLSHEAYDKVMEMKGGQDQEDDESSTLETQDVINWVCQNTKEFNEDGILYWSLAGKNYAQKLAAEDSFHYLEHNIAGLSQVAKILGSQCVDDEVLLLLQMYGVFTENALLVSLIPGWFNLVKDKLVSKNGGRDLEEEVLKKFYSICDGIVQRCLTQVPNKMHITSMLEEEQEKELEKEVEVEEERQIERPTRAQEAVPQLHPNVTDTVVNGREIVQKAGIQRLSDAFQYTSFWNEVQPECWGMEVFATGDFNSVIKLPNNYFKTDLHLRPVEYLVSRVDKQGNLQLLVLSPFEVNELMPLFRKGKTPLKLHMFTMRSFERQDVLINNDRLQLPLCRPVSVISEESRAMAAMLLASGSLYFNSQSEQEAFARYLALIPQPWTDQQTLAFESGMITNTGFLRADSAFRKANWEDFMVETFSFTEDPIKLVKKILRCRHPVVNEVAHVIRLLDDAFLVPIDY